MPLREEAYALLNAIGPKKAGRVFNTTGPAIGTAWHRVRERAGIEDLHFHDLRHEATSRFFEDASKFGLTDTEIGSITGHKTWAMLQRYTHLRSVDIAAKLRPHAMRPAQQTSLLFAGISGFESFSGVHC
ncbi:MAG: tyrosine-type recombinase/integrase [Pseudomonadota bacterium]